MNDRVSKSLISKKTTELSERVEEMPNPDETTRAFAFTEWLGAFANWIARFGSKRINDLYESKYRKRNFIVGYLITLLFVTALMAFLIIKTSE